MEAESDDMEVQQISGGSSQLQQQQGQQAVALVLPIVEQQMSTTETTQIQVQLLAEQSVVVASSQANSSNTVTTTRAGVKRQRESVGDNSSRTEKKSIAASQVWSRNVILFIPYFSIDNAYLMYNAHPKLFRHSFWCVDNAHDVFFHR